MTRSFIIDNMLPRDLAEFLISQGHDAKTRARMQLGSVSDLAIWNHAEATGAIVISKDSDFESLARRSSKSHLIHFRGGNMTTTELVSKFRESLPTILEAIVAGERVIEIW